jgi:nitrate reductase assembly molybdenum cofactor insertion protein NarJ
MLPFFLHEKFTVGLIINYPATKQLTNLAINLQTMDPLQYQIQYTDLIINPTLQSSYIVNSYYVDSRDRMTEVLVILHAFVT